MRDRTARVLALCGLVLGALGWTGVGSAVREAVLPARSVGTAQIKDGAVTSEKIRTGAVRSSDLADGTVRARDLAPGAVPDPLAFVVRRSVLEIGTVGEFELKIPCDSGQTPVAGGGGFLSSTATSYVGNQFYGSLINSAPISGDEATDDRGAATGWIVTARNAGGKKRLAGYVICAYTPEPEQPPPTKAPPPG